MTAADGSVGAGRGVTVGAVRVGACECQHGDHLATGAGAPGRAHVFRAAEILTHYSRWVDGPICPACAHGCMGEAPQLVEPLRGLERAVSPAAARRVVA